MRIALHGLMEEKGRKGKGAREVVTRLPPPRDGSLVVFCVSFLESSEAWRLGLAYSELTYSSRIGRALIPLIISRESSAA